MQTDVGQCMVQWSTHLCGKTVHRRASCRRIAPAFHIHLRSCTAGSSPPARSSGPNTRWGTCRGWDRCSALRSDSRAGKRLTESALYLGVRWWRSGTHLAGSDVRGSPAGTHSDHERTGLRSCSGADNVRETWDVTWLRFSTRPSVGSKVLGKPGPALPAVRRVPK